MDKIEIAKRIIDSIDFTELHFKGGTHITFEDGNIDDRSIEFCLYSSFNLNRLKCTAICAIMLSCTTNERIDLVKRGGYFGEFRTNEQIKEKHETEVK